MPRATHKINRRWVLGFSGDLYTRRQYATDTVPFVCPLSPDEGDEGAFHERMERWAGDLERVVFVDSIGGMSLES